MDLYIAYMHDITLSVCISGSMIEDNRNVSTNLDIILNMNWNFSRLRTRYCMVLVLKKIIYYDKQQNFGHTMT